VLYVLDLATIQGLEKGNLSCVVGVASLCIQVARAAEQSQLFRINASSVTSQVM
jgi:hypothetical protein